MAGLVLLRPYAATRTSAKQCPNGGGPRPTIPWVDDEDKADLEWPRDQLPKTMAHKISPLTPKTRYIFIPIHRGAHWYLALANLGSSADAYKDGITHTLSLTPSRIRWLRTNASERIRTTRGCSFSTCRPSYKTYSATS